MLTCLLFGLTPAWQVSRTAAVEAIRNAGRIVQPRRNGVLRNGLVMAQVALSFVLLIGADLMFTTVARLERVNTGFDPDGILTLRTSWFPPAGLRDSNEHAAHMAAFYDAVLLRLRNLPGVEAAAATATLPLSGGDPYLPFRSEGDLPVPKGEEQRVDQQRCTTDYFRAMRIPVLRGRVFESRDGFGNGAVAVIDDAFARRFLPGRDPLGQHILFDDGGGPRTIVGIVGSVRHRSLATPATPEVYLHQAQWPSSGMTLVVRAAADPARLVPAIREAVRAADPTIPVSAIQTMQQVWRARLPTAAL